MRICDRCFVNEVYLDIYTQTWCEPCIYEVAMSEDTSEIELQRLLDKDRKLDTLRT